MHLEIIGLGQEEVPMYLYVPLLGKGSYEIRVPPGVNRFGLRTRHGAFVASTRTLSPGGRTQLAYQGPFRASAEVLRWDRRYLSVWFDVSDTAGNYVNGFTDTTAHLTLKREGETVFDGGVSRSCGRVVEVVRDWGEGWAEKPLQYEFRLLSPLTGTVVSRGLLHPRQTIDQKLVRVHPTSLFEVFARERTPNGVRVAEALQAAHAALSAAIAGPVTPSHGGRFRVQFTSPFGIAWSSGDTVALDLYAANWFWPSVCGEAMLPTLHEFGHSYSLVPPRTPPGWGESEGQTFANWLAYQALRGAFGERAYQAARVEQNSAFFSTPSDQPFDGLLFVMDYIDQRYGTAINRELYRILYAGEGDLRGKVERFPQLKTEHERLAVLHSKLTSQNLAWLYRWGHLSVSDETVNKGLERLTR
jgi:hypothetical protein